MGFRRLLWTAPFGAAVLAIPTLVFGQPDFAVTKTDSPDPVVAGTNLTYTITVANIGSTAAAVTLSDSIPADTTFVSFTAPVGFTVMTPVVGGTGTVTATNGAAAVGNHTFTMVVNVDASTADGATLTNTASLSSDPNPGNNSDTETTSVIAQADLSVTKTDSPDPVNAGANLTYTITVTNAGPSDAQNVMLSDPTPVNTTFVSFMQTAGPAFTLITPAPGGTGNVTATATTVAAGATATFQLVVNVNGATPGGSMISNTATVSSTTTDPDGPNNSDTETTDVVAVDFAVTKTDSPDPVVAGTNLTYTITVANIGSTAAAVTLSDSIPADTTFVSFTAPVGFTVMTPVVGGTGTVTATNGAAAVGNHTFTMVVNVDASTADGATLTNTASLSSDPNPGNNSDTETTSVIAQADLSVTKTDSPDPVNAGANLTYTITVTNAGPSDAQNVMLSDPTPVNTTFVSFMQTAGPAFTLITPAPGGTGNVTATATTVAAGATALFQLIVKVDASASGTLTNTVTVSSATTDTDPTNNSDTETTLVVAASELSVTKIDNPDPVSPGQNLVYTITVGNNGFLAAALVVLNDVVPADTRFVSLTAPAGWTTITPPPGGTGSVSATIPSLPGLTSATFVLVVNVDIGTSSGTTITNTAVVSGDIDDMDPANNSATATTTVAAVGAPAPAPALSLLGLAIAVLLLLGIAMWRQRARAW